MTTGGFGDEDFGASDFGGTAPDEDEGGDTPAPVPPGPVPVPQTPTPVVFGKWWKAIVDGVGSSIDGKAIQFFDDSERGSYGQGAPPAVNVRFIDDAYAEPHSARRGGLGQDVLWRVDMRVSLHVWGVDIEQAHELRRRVIVALHNAAHGNYRVEGGAWNTGDVASSLGVSNVFVTVWEIPIVRDPEALAVISTFENDVGIEGD